VTVQLDPEIRRLLYEQIASFEELEALLLLHRAPATALSAAAVAARLRVEPSAVAVALSQLTGRGLLQLEKNSEPPSYRYAPANSQTAAVIDRLAQLYADQPVDVIKEMSANAIERLRSSAARAFADAFVFKGKKDDR
jgi:predicted ArsR family transcriptional regulator